MATTLIEPAEANPPTRVVEPFWNVPNAITLSRLGLAVFVFVAVSYGYFLPALVIFVAAALTDALDGYVARRLNQATAIGRQLDPLVDKVIVCGSYIYLLTVPTVETGVYPWMVTTIVIRELLIQGLRSHLEGGGQAFGAKTAGKLKTLFQCISVSAILVVLWLRPGGSLLPWVRDLTTWSAVGLTIYSGLGYFALAIRQLRGASATPPPR